MIFDACRPLTGRSGIGPAEVEVPDALALYRGQRRGASHGRRFCAVLVDPTSVKVGVVALRLVGHGLTALNTCRTERSGRCRFAGRAKRARPGEMGFHRVAQASTHARVTPGTCLCGKNGSPRPAKPLSDHHKPFPWRKKKEIRARGSIKGEWRKEWQNKIL